MSFQWSGVFVSVLTLPLPCHRYNLHTNNLYFLCISLSLFIYISIYKSISLYLILFLSCSLSH